jgi:hypothetical protein
VLSMTNGISSAMGTCEGALYRHGREGEDQRTRMNVFAKAQEGKTELEDAAVVKLACGMSRSGG